jgi:hypothetical protein
LAVLVASLTACGSSPNPAPSGVTAPPVGTLLVVLNRTETPIWLAGMLAPACSQSNFDRVQIDKAAAAALDGADPPPGAVDWSNVNLAQPQGSPGPIIVLVTADRPKLTFGVWPSVVPECHGVAPGMPA